MTEFAKHVDTEQLEAPNQWHEVVPLIDAAVNRLPKTDRQVVVLRFLEGQTYRYIGKQVGKSEEAIRKQLARALTKLSRQLRKAGVAISAAALATGLDSARAIVSKHRHRASRRTTPWRDSERIP